MANKYVSLKTLRILGQTDARWRIVYQEEMDKLFHGEVPWKHVIRNDNYEEARLLLEDPIYGCGRQLVADAVRAQAYNVIDAIAHTNPLCLFSELHGIGIPKDKLNVILPGHTLVDIFYNPNQDIKILFNSRFWLDNPELLASMASVGYRQFVDVANLFLNNGGNKEYVRAAYQNARLSDEVLYTTKCNIAKYVEEL